MSAELTIYKSGTLAIQDVSIYDENFHLLKKRTLVNERDYCIETLNPGAYLVIGTGPNGRQIERRIDLTQNDQQTIYMDADVASPHEWLADMSARQALPPSDLQTEESEAIIPFQVAELVRHGTKPILKFALDTLQPSVSALGVGQSSEGFLRDVGYPVLKARRRPRRDFLRQRVRLHSYAWSSSKLRWIRSGLIESIEGVGGGDFLRFDFPGRREDDERLHMIGLFQENRPATMISLPLFSEGTHLVLGAKQELAAGDGASRRVTWQLSASNETIDAMLQSLAAGSFSDKEAVSNMALDASEKMLFEKRENPEAAVVAALFLLKHRRRFSRGTWVENLANWTPWSPDAQVVGAWANLLLGTGNESTAMSKLALTYRAGPPQLRMTQKYMRDLLSPVMSGEDEVGMEPHIWSQLQKVWSRLRLTAKNAASESAFFSYEVDFKNKN